MQEGDAEEADISIKLALSIYRSNSEEKNKWENPGELQDNKSKGIPIAVTYSPDLQHSINWHRCYLLLIQTKTCFI